MVDCVECATKRNMEDVGDGSVVQLLTPPYYSPVFVPVLYLRAGIGVL